MSVAEKINSEIIQTENKIIQPKKMGLLVENPVYKPFRYPWCYDAWLNTAENPLVTRGSSFRR